LTSKLASKENHLLTDLHGQCELNFLRLEQIFPDMRLTLKTLIYAGVKDQLRMEIEVIDRAPYTTHLFVRGEVSGLPWAGEMEMDVQMYHDARMAEVSRYSSQKLVFIRNRYPNAQMFQRHEKWHANQFLGVWLDYFIQSGHEYSATLGPLGND
jgi:hypothetical protein